MITDEEQKIRDLLYGKLKLGEKMRREYPYKGPRSETNGLFHMLETYGWVREDLRQALMVYKPEYEKNQVAFLQGLKDNPNFMLHTPVGQVFKLMDGSWWIATESEVRRYVP